MVFFHEWEHRTVLLENGKHFSKGSLEIISEQDFKIENVKREFTAEVKEWNCSCENYITRSLRSNPEGLGEEIMVDMCLMIEQVVEIIKLAFRFKSVTLFSRL
ncbi:hypothetical protein HNV12_24700, partial [Methanococcoides sp. SA1]|nr:hypothetical protein [Methanococcoides sp. SA1]